MLVAAANGAGPAHAQPASATDDWPARRAAIATALAQELETLALRCDELGMPNEAATTRQWVLARDPDRQYVFLPQWSAPAPSPDAADNVKFWQQHFLDIRRQYAVELFALAQAAAEGGRSDLALGWLVEVVREDPDHEAARRVLGFRRAPNGTWSEVTAGANRAIRVSPARRPQDKLGWEAGDYTEVDSPHFRIVTTAPSDDARQLVEAFERWRWVWLQVYARHWLDDRELVQALQDQRMLRMPSSRYECALLPDRQAYLDQLRSVPGSELSVGFYDDKLQMSLFYLGDDVEETWRHELVHQFFQESVETRPGPADEAHLWAVEGAAIYFELMIEHDGYVTLGGPDARRLQFARLYLLRYGQYLPLVELDAISRSAMHGREDISALYDQSAAMVQMLMTADGGSRRDGFVRFVSSLYARDDRRLTAAEALGAPLPEIDDRYRQWLGDVAVETLARLAAPSEQTELELSATRLDDAGLAGLGQCGRLRWLGLSDNQITGSGLTVLAAMPELEWLFLDRNPLGDAALAHVGQLTNLQQLDLTSTDITDQGLAAIGRLGRLKALWLADTAIGDAGLAELGGLSELEMLDVRRTNVTAAAIDELRKKLPNLKTVVGP